jgi:hypothetical protein
MVLDVCLRLRWPLLVHTRERQLTIDIVIYSDADRMMPDDSPPLDGFMWERRGDNMVKLFGFDRS